MDRQQRQQDNGKEQRYEEFCGFVWRGGVTLKLCWNFQDDSFYQADWPMKNVSESVDVFFFFLGVLENRHPKRIFGDVENEKAVFDFRLTF